ncbi:MAG TPA: diguanylate cyclase [Epsilonproteobacteria bacterium]|nr:diguanylate cyclase [Campylobacterota bacterium]
MTLKDYLQSEYELKSKFILMNSMFSMGLLLISILTIFLFLDGKVLFAVFACIYICVNASLVYLLRLSRSAHRYIVPVISLAAVGLLAIALIVYPEEQVRIAWFLVLIVPAFFLGGGLLGVITTVFSVVAVVAIGYFSNIAMNEYAILLAAVIIFIGGLFVDQYEKRSKKTQEILLGINQKLKKQKAVFEHLAHHDTLTGLPNRVLFRDRLEHAIDIAKRDSTKLTVLFMDLDHFKEINDSLGHQLGDEVLQITAERLQKVLRGSDSIARLGGDEFTVLIEDINKGTEIETIAQKLIQAVKESITVQNHKLYLTASIGISIYPHDGEDAETLLKNADAAMYSAKQNGRNTYHYFCKTSGLSLWETYTSRCDSENNAKSKQKGMTDGQRIS